VWVAAVINAGALAALAWQLPRWQVAHFIPPSTSLVLACAAVLFAVFGIVEGFGARRAAWCGLATVALVLRLALDQTLLPYADRQTVERPLAAAVRQHLPPSAVPLAHRWWRASFVAYGVRGWTHTENRDELGAALASAAKAGRPALVLARADSEGEVRAAAWNAGGAAREVARISGLGEIDGKILEGIVFLVDRERGGTRFFYDGDSTLAGGEGFSGVEGNAWTPTFRWSVASIARLRLDARPPGDAVLRLRAWGRAHAGQPQRLSLSLNGCPLGELTLDQFPAVIAVRVPASCLRDAPQDLVLTTSHLDIPKESDPGSSDTRTLGFALDWLALDPLRDPGERPHSATRR
jgi:hypothetical protein